MNTNWLTTLLAGAVPMLLTGSRDKLPKQEEQDKGAKEKQDQQTNG